MGHGGYEKEFRARPRPAWDTVEHHRAYIHRNTNDQAVFEDKAFLNSVLTKIKLGRLGQVEDIMGAVIYLASDASSLVTGSSMVVDGGWTVD